MGPGRIKGNIIVLALLVFIWPAPGSANLIDEVSSYFSPASGVLVAIHEDEFLVNLDASSGVMAGDLLSIVVPGEKLIDPLNGKVLGSLDRVKGVLKVTRVRSGFSQASPLGELSGVQTGDRVRRYQNLTASYTTNAGSGSDLYKQLVRALPALEWQGYYALSESFTLPVEQTERRAQLTFVLTDTSLDVHDSAGQLLHAFSTINKTASLDHRAQRLDDIASPSPATTQGQPPGVAWEKSGQGGNAQATYRADYPGFKTLGEFNETVLSADFFPRGKQLLIAGSDGDQLTVSVLADHMTVVATQRIRPQTKIHAVAWWQQELAGPLYLAVTASATKSFSFSASVETVFTSSIFEFKEDQLISLQENLPYLLGTFDRNGDGIKETLLGQRFDLDTIYGPIRELTLTDGGYAERVLDLELPRGFPVQGSILADLTGDGSAEAIYTRRGILYIISKGKLLYESAKQMGGSLSRFTYDLNPGQADTLFTTVAFEVPQVAADIDGDGQPELIVVSTDTSAFSAPGLDSGRVSWLSVIKYRDGRFIKGTLGEQLEKPIQGLAVNQGKALIVLSRQASILSGQGQSHLLALSLEP